MKTLYFYSDINNPKDSDSFRSQLKADGVAFTELVLGKDFRKHDVTFSGIQAVIDVDGTAFEEVQTLADVLSRFNKAPDTMPAIIVPPPDPLDVLDTKDSKLWTIEDVANWLKAQRRNP